MAVFAHRKLLLCVLIVVVVLGVSAYGVREFFRSRAVSEPSVVADFSLLDQAGRLHQLSRYTTARAVVLYAHDLECPASREGLAALQEMRRRFAPQQLAVLAVDANPRDDRGRLSREAPDVPILHDDGQLVTDSLRVTRTGEAIVVDTRSWRIVYRGSPRSRRLLDAATAAVEGRAVTVDAGSATAIGCPIARDERAAKRGEISYAADVAPILNAKCVACHRPGGIGPWAMDGYDKVKTWSPRMRAALMTGRMPPWQADPAIGTFAHDRSLSVDQKRTLVRWIDAGAPRGGDADPLSANPAPPGEEWPLGKPDLVLDLPVQEIPATGTLDYIYVQVPAPVSQDTWVRALHMTPSNPAVMHHAALFLEYPTTWQHQQPKWHGGAAGFFGAYAPGLQPVAFPPDAGGFLPAGATLLFQLHYTTNGQATTDRPRVAFYFHPRPPELEARVVAGVNHEFVLPPNVEDFPVETSYVFDRAVTLHGMLPHMHHRGKRFRYEAHYPDGTREVLLSVPRYDFNWQTFYMLRTPRAIPAQTKIVMTGAFDNSARNPANPDPSKEVRWGHQSWDEMFIGYMMYTAPKPVRPAAAGR
jgi:hypothetical protein